MPWLALLAAVGPTDAAAIPITHSIGVAVYTKKQVAIARRVKVEVRRMDTKLQVGRTAEELARVE